MTRSASTHVQNDSGLIRLHPLTKLTISGVILVLGLIAFGLWFGYIAFVVVVVPLAMWGRLLRPLLRGVLRTVIPFAIALFLIQGFLWINGTPIFSIGIVSLKIEGVRYATSAVGRILLVVSSIIFLTLSTPPDALMVGVTERGFSSKIAYILLTTIQIVPRFQAKAQQIIDAQSARGLETTGSFIQRFRALVPLVVPLVLGSIVDVEERAIALEARAFSRQGPKTSLLVLTDTRAQAVARWLMLAAALAVVVLRFVPGGLP